MFASALLVFALASGALAEDRRAKVSVGEFKTVTTTSDIQRIAVADPEITDYTVISKREVLINGKKMGITSLNIWMTDKRENYLVEVADPRQAKLQRLAGLEGKIVEIFNNPDINITYTDRGVILSGKAKSEEQKADVEKIMRAYMPDKDQEVTNVIEVWRKPRLVRIKVRVMQIDESATKNLGIDWGSFSQSSAPAVTTYSGLFHDQYVLAGTLAKGTNPRFMAGFRRSQPFTMVDPIIAQVNALIDSGIIRVLSEPEVVSLIGSSSDVLSGGEIPVPVASANNTVTIQWKEFGVRMKLQPDVGDDGRISSNVYAEVSTLDFANGVTLSGFTVPAIKITKAITKIHVKPGRTVFLSGLKREIDSNSKKSVPGLSTIPVMGEAFITRSKKRETVDLIISVTPYLVEEDAENGG